jgi:hypothetical protein
MDQWITIRQAAQMTAKSESTIRRAIKSLGLKTETRRVGSSTKVYLDRGQLLMMYALKEDPDKVGALVTTRAPVEQVDGVLLLKEMNRKLEQDNKDLKAENIKLREKIEALNEEIKALLREGRKSRGIMGYIVDKVWRG